MSAFGRFTKSRVVPKLGVFTCQFLPLLNCSMNDSGLRGDLTPQILAEHDDDYSSRKVERLAAMIVLSPWE